jgi:hypothetical protein
VVDAQVAAVGGLAAASFGVLGHEPEPVKVSV